MDSYTIKGMLSRRQVLLYTALAGLALPFGIPSARQADALDAVSEFEIVGNYSPEQISDMLVKCLLAEGNETSTYSYPGETVISEYQDQIYYGATSAENVHHIHDIKHKTIYFTNGYYLGSVSRYKDTGTYTTDGYPIWENYFCINNWVTY